MFKKRNLKTASASRRREDAGIGPDDTATTSFATEPALKKSKPQPKPTREIDFASTSKNADKEPVSGPFQDSDDETNDDPKSSPKTEKPKIVGPKAAPKNVRVTTLTDFQPDICKDFQQTGYCGYGDTCKFLHIRDESRQKKAIEKEWETVGKTDAKTADTRAVDVPFKCPICKEDYKKPVETPCGHVFCQGCFMARFKQEKKRKCFICKKDTGGSVQPVKGK